MKDLLNTLVDMTLWLLLWGMAAYAILCFAAYSAAAEEKEGWKGIPMSLSNKLPLSKDEEIIAITLMGEARGEKQAGLYAVGCVIQQRSIERKLTPAQVCLQNRLNKNGVRVWQFSCWNDKPYIETMKRLLKENTKQAQYAKLLSRSICKEWKLVQSFTGGANHYHANSVKPYWIKGKTPTKIIGNHLFYKLP